MFTEYLAKLDPIVSNKKDVINSTKEAYHNQEPKNHSFN